MHKKYCLLFLELNKRGGWNISRKVIKGEALIRVSRVEKIPEINKRASPFIRKVRVNASSYKTLPFRPKIRFFLFSDKKITLRDRNYN